MFEKCPECGRNTLAYDEYYQRVMCFSTACMASELSSDAIRKIAKKRNMKMKQSKSVYMDEQDEHEVMLSIIRILYNERKVDNLPSDLDFHMHCILDDYYQYNNETDTFKEHDTSE